MRTLRVTVIGKFYEDSFATGIARAFETLGHTVQQLDDERFALRVPDARLRMAWRALLDSVPAVDTFLTRRIAGNVLTFRPDLVVSVSKTLPPGVIEAIKNQSDAIAVFWFPDAISNLGRQLFLASPFDLFCFKDHFLVDVMRKRIGLNARFLPDATTSNSLHAPPGPQACEVLIACNLYPYRLRLLERLEGFDLRIYGNAPRWLRSPVMKAFQGEYLSGPRKVAAYRSAAIVFNNNHFAEIAGINARTFEVCGAGAFLLTDNHPALGEYYEPNTEVGVYEGVDDVREQITFFLSRPALREQMAKKAFARTLNEHQYTHRVTRLLEYAGMVPAAT